MLRKASRLLFLLVPFVALAQTGFAKANANAYGVTVTVFSDTGYNNAPPLPPDGIEVGTTVQDQIINNFDSQPLFNMYEDFIVKYEAFLTTDTEADVWFYAPADDGVRLYLDGQLLIDDWYDKGGGGSVSNAMHFAAGESKSMTMWFYENGGGAWVQLYWLKDGVWELIPATAFTRMAVPTTTTTEPTTTTTEPPTTTEPELTTTTSTTSSTTSTTSTSTTSTTSTTTTSVAPVETVPPVITPETSSTSTAAPTTTVYATTSTVPLTTTTEPPPTTLIPTTTTSVPVVETLLTNPSQSVSFHELATVLATDEIKDVTPEEAAVLVTTIEASLDNLSTEELMLLADALSNAPSTLKKAFEAQINVFDGKFDGYIPTGSVVSVRTRRTINAVAAAFVCINATARPQRRIK